MVRVEGLDFLAKSRDVVPKLGLVFGGHIIIYFKLSNRSTS